MIKHEFRKHFCKIETATCPKEFGLKAKLRLKIPLKMKDNFIGNKKIAKETRRNAKLSQDEMLGKGMGEV